MSNVLHLTAAKAASVQSGGISGQSTINPDCVLIPVALTDGTFLVGTEVTADPAYADRIFTGIPVVDYATVSALVPVTSAH